VSGIEPDDDNSAPLHSARRQRIIRVVALLAMMALVVPSAIGTWLQARSSAVFACELARSQLAPDSQSVGVEFRLTPLRAAGWQCFARYYDGSEILIAVLGPIPGEPQIKPVGRS
jgi:hypothetical protein